MLSHFPCHRPPSVRCRHQTANPARTLWCGAYFLMEWIPSFLRRRRRRSWSSRHTNPGTHMGRAHTEPTENSEAKKKTLLANKSPRLCNAGCSSHQFSHQIRGPNSGIGVPDYSFSLIWEENYEKLKYTFRFHKAQMKFRVELTKETLRSS